VVKVLFVCLGNICRSPAAEGVFYHLIRKEQLSDDIYCDSAGTSAYHVGQRADERMREVAEKRGYKLLSLARQVEPDDFEEFDYIIAMDRSNYDDLMELCPAAQFKNRIHQFISFTSSKEDGVPDPYYLEQEGFSYVLDLIEEGCGNIMEKIKQQIRG
jgi:protein-tyrosine phosphatase